VSAGGNFTGGERAGLHRIEVEHAGQEGRRLVMDFAIDIDAMLDPVSPLTYAITKIWPLSIRALRQRFAVQAGLINVKNPRRNGRPETCVYNGRGLVFQFLQQDVGQLRFQAHDNLHMWYKR